MPNNYFQFKQFIIHQEHCAMKVTTDACLFGAWAAGAVDSGLSTVDHVLDIGTGTGLLSLMLAQKTSSQIHAVEIDEAVANQAKDNFAESPWKERMHVHHSSIQQFNNSSIQQSSNPLIRQLPNPPIPKFDFIITNPPFFDNDLKSDDAKRNLALHSAELSLEELLEAIKQNLSSNGSFAILLPYHRTDSFISLAKDFSLQQKTLVRQTEKHGYFRSMLLFSSKQLGTVETEITIKENNQYTAAFISLLKDYYLHL
jgi:tRNA1Val (adenine37-N6)-methyltransferase